MKKKRRKIKPLALLLALTLVLTGLSLPPTEVQAKSALDCKCISNGGHDVGTSITDWATSSSGRQTILGWNESTATSKDVHVLRKSNGNKFLAWYQKNKTASNAAHYHTDGYHLTKGWYQCNGGSIAAEYPDCKIMENSGFTQVRIGSAGSGQHYTLYYVEYEKMIDMCKKLDLKLIKDSNGSYYVAYLQPYISCFNGSGTRVLTSGRSYDTVYSWFCKLYSAETQRDLKEKYNVRFRIPATEVPVTIRYWDVSAKDSKDDAELMYSQQGNPYVFETNQTAIIYSDLYRQGIRCEVDLAEVVKSTSGRFPDAVKPIFHYDSKDKPEGKGVFVGCQALVGSAAGKTKFELSENSAVRFKFAELEKEDEVKPDAKYTVAKDNRDKEITLEGKEVTAERLLESAVSSCKFDKVYKGNPVKGDGAVLYSGITDKDVCYLDIMFVNQEKTENEYEVTRRVVDYNPESGKMRNEEKLDEDLIVRAKVKDDNITEDKHFTKTLASDKFPDYTDSDKEKALGNVIVDGHNYVLAASTLGVKDDSSKKERSWYNKHEKATDWAASDSLKTLDGNYAYKTPALTKKLKSYRFYTDSKKIASYDGEATWSINLMYVCRPPAVRLEYVYDADADEYRLISTSPASLDKPDGLEYQYANTTVSKKVKTDLNGEPLQQVYVTTGDLAAYDGTKTSAYSKSKPPAYVSSFDLPNNRGTVKLPNKTVTNSDRSGSSYSVNFTMPYDTAYIVCVYGDERETDTPGYTKVMIRETAGGYKVEDAEYHPDSNPKAKDVVVEFPSDGLKDVGYAYAKVNQPNVPDSYSGKPGATWGGKAKDTYKYVSTKTPALNQNLIVYGIYEKKSDLGSGEKEWEETERIPGKRPDWIDGDDSSEAPGLGISASAGDMRSWIVNDRNKSTSPDYQVETAIPTSEYQNTYSGVYKYFAVLDQIKHTWHFQTTVTVKEQKYELVTDPDAPDYGDYRYKSTTNHRVPVERSTVFYTLEDGNVLTPMDCTVFNDTLTLQEKVKMQAQNKYWENGNLCFKVLSTAGTKRPSVTSSVTITSHGSDASSERIRSAAERAVGKYTSCNDAVQFSNGEGGKTMLSDSEYSVENEPIEEAPEAGLSSTEEGEHVFDEWGVFIPADRTNGTHDSRSVVHYGTWHSTAGSSYDKLLGIYCNSVTVHTPAMCVCNLITDENKVQRLQQPVSKNLVLDTSFKVHCSAEGQFRNYPGYGYRDYRKWLYTDVFDGKAIKAMQVKFPFAVMRHNGETGIDSYFVANTWIPVPIGDTEFYVPSWDDEVDLTAVRWRAVAENAEVLDSYSADDGRTIKPASDIDALVYESRLAKTEYTANSSIENYVGWMEELTSISGRIYDMSIFDVTDYPTWEPVFRTGSAEKPNELTGFSYTSGLCNRDGFTNGSVGETTFPMVKGSNRYNAKAGAVKPGYAIRFKFETVGMMDDDNDSVKIKPSFTWISKDGTQKKRVDVYYNETFDGKKQQFVKVGSNLDATNRHALSMGDDQWGIDQDAIDRTAAARGLSSAKELMDRKEYCWSPGLINLKANMNTFDGWLHKTILSDGTPYDWSELKERIVVQNSITGVTRDSVLSSVQDWYCNYYLPSEIFVTKKGTKIEDYLGAEFTGDEECWIKDGYLVVNFDLVTVDGNNERLTYNCLIHETPTADGLDTYTGLCDMWKWEGYVNSKMDTDGITFPFEDGDIFMYEIGGASANSDYTNGGTH